MNKYTFENIGMDLNMSSQERAVDALIIGYAALARAIDKLNPEFASKLFETLDNAYKMNDGVPCHKEIAQLAMITKVALTKTE
ncbi:hypothetical protein L8P05_10750 [Enterobacter cloacae]|uniref:hypothetical protein n=1 Tax=Enterobacter cloacae TaxID=550 RepID=UPI0020065F44|nr:hypothetical protein [Enterobacter cloacae]MCK7174398.1 hypothetical protein [Enterobacter cloacae]